MKEIMDASSMKRSLVRMAHEIVEKNKGVEGLVLDRHQDPRRISGGAFETDDRSV